MTTTTTNSGNPTAAQATDPAAGKGRSVTAGFSDGLGDRQLMFDPSTATSLELLQFKPEFADVPEFETALRARVEDLRNVQHPSLATIQGVERRADGALVLASKLVSGRRVSELIPKARGAAFAIELIRLITPALALIHKSGDRVAHGALTPDRIIVTRDGRLMVVEHALGSAIEALKLGRSKLNEIGIAVPIGEHIQLDPRTDMAQLGYIALSLLLGRQLDAADFPLGVPALLDEFVMSSNSPMLSAKMRTWLERAMQISPRGFASAKEASDALHELPDDADIRMSETNTSVPPPVVEKGGNGNGKEKPLRVAASPQSAAMAASERSKRDVPDFLSESASSRGGSGSKAPWLTVALGVLAAVEGVAIGYLLYTRQDAPPSVSQSSAQVASVLPHSSPLTSPSPSPVVPSPSPVAAASPSPAPSTAPAVVAPQAAAAAAAPAGPRFGGITVTSPIELKVFKDGNLLGTTGGPIAVNEGSQTLLFTNEALGFRTMQTVKVQSGQMTAVKIGVPNGRISINAIPWAEVTIDGTPAGETPIANFSLPIGTHEIVFRHPQLGEKRKTVVVPVEGLVRVTETLQPGGDR